MDLFRGYVPTKNKTPTIPYGDGASLKTLEEVRHCAEYAGVLGQDTVLIDIDNEEMANVFADICEEQNINCQMRETTRGMHFYFLNGGRITKCYTGVYLACGIVADIKCGVKNSISVLKKDGQEREIVYNYEPYESVPVWALPIDSNDRGLWKMKDGDGRDTTLFSYILTLVKHGISKDDCKKILAIINNHVFADKLTDKDIDRITREEAFPKDTFFEKGHFLHDKFGDYLIAEHKIKKVDGVLCYYSDGEYVNALPMLDNLCLRHIRSLPAKSRTEVGKYIQGILAEDVEAADPRYITFSNGVLDVETMEFCPITHNVVARNIIRHRYNPNAYSKIADTTLDRLSCGDEQIRATLEECIGYGFYRRNELSKAFLMTGDKSNGKSTFLEVLQCIYGERNASALDLAELDERFNVAELAGKLVNIGDDISDEFLQGKAVSMFKKIVSGNRVKGEYKGQDPFFFRPYCKLFFSANDIPRTRDKTGAVLRRLVIIPFNAKFTDKDKDYDPYIIDKLKKEESIEYMIKLGIDGLKRVLTNKCFTEGKAVRQAIDEYELENNPLLSFTKEVDVINRLTNDVYRQYRQYCFDNGFKELNKITFSRELCRALNLTTKSVKINEGYKRIYVFLE